MVWENNVMSELSKTELLEQVELLKLELAHVKRQLNKKSHQASVYSKMMHGAMRRLPDEWFPFKSSIAVEHEPVQESNEIGNERRFAIRDSWIMFQRKLKVHVKPR
tara:strand:- start:2040 stop:2357 length:318 start_codon:yes stop_codon:yes gene_type:complete